MAMALAVVLSTQPVLVAAAIMKATRNAPHPYYYSPELQLPFLLLPWLFFTCFGIVIASALYAESESVLYCVSLAGIFVLLGLPFLLITLWLLKHPNDEQFSRSAGSTPADDEGKPALKPIRLPPEWPDIDCPRKRIKEKLPFLGCFVGLFYADRYYELDRRVGEEFERRNCTIQELWSDYPEYMSVVLDMQKILKKTLWANPLFAPEDEYPMIGMFYTGNLCELEAVREMEETLGVKLWEGRDFLPVLKGTTLDVVKYIHEHRGTLDK